MRSSFVKVGSRYINLNHVALVEPNGRGGLGVYFSLPASTGAAGAPMRPGDSPHLIIHLEGDDAETFRDAVMAEDDGSAADLSRAVLGLPAA